MRMLVCASCALIFVAGSATAADAPLSFGGLITDSCIINPGGAGVFAMNEDGTRVSTENGIAATAVVVTTSTQYELEVLPPSQFNPGSPSGANSNVVFSTTMSASGVTDLTNVLENTAEQLGLGLTTVDVDMTAVKSVGGFPAGTYTATATLRCTAI